MSYSSSPCTGVDNMRPELIVASKEFRDHISSKRFIIIFAVLMLLSVYSMVNGMGQYNQTLEQYKQSAQTNPQQQWYQDEVASLQTQIQDAAARGATDEVRQLQSQLDAAGEPADAIDALYLRRPDAVLRADRDGSLGGHRL